MRNNYIEILNHKVEIPIIQRDYAQGRTDVKTSKIRKDFLDVLFELIHSKYSEASNTEIELDFIYGFNEQDNTSQTTFIPIDGQQRLTALWLLYWFVSVKEKITGDETAFLSNFSYETRHSTTEFCKGLIKFKPDFTGGTISEAIKDQAWYFDTWAFDPSIQAMLTVMDDIQARYDLLNIPSVWYLIGGSACPFYFYKLDMNKVGLTDDLYIKMNSRGKALTEFEYFKAGFSELLTVTEQKERFEKSIDGEWIEVIWHIVLDSGSISNEDDIALVVDNSFLNLFNFITSVIAFKKDIKNEKGSRYEDTEVSRDLLKIIYIDTENQTILFDTLDAICNQQSKDPLFWNTCFYFNKDEFNPSKTRLFFPHQEVNLLKRCLFHSSGNRGLSFPEQLLLHACFTQLKSPNNEFENRIRTVRNLVVNSENELRDIILGFSFDEIEHYILNGNLAAIGSLKSDQKEEEEKKKQFLMQSTTETNILRQLEDSEIFRGSISLFPFDLNFANRASKFLELFDEDEMITSFGDKCNVLLCFGDYSQDDGSLTNLMSPGKPIIRNFFTSPGYSKVQFYSKTQAVVLACLDFFIANPNFTAAMKIEETITYYTTNPKDWKYYFMRYPSFREECHYGYFSWSDEHYCIWKMGRKQFNGYHWDPFLYQLICVEIAKNLSLDKYGSKLLFTHNRKKLLISSLPKGFLFENGMSSGVANSLMDELINSGIINANGALVVSQNIKGIDLEDRLEKLNRVFDTILNNKD